jgi:signal peptidase I
LRRKGSSEYIRYGGEDILYMEALVEILKAVIEKGKSFRIQAFGFSMYPFIRNNDYITISPLAPAQPKLGDIVAYIQPGTKRLTVHRIVDNKGDFFLIKGDNNTRPDGLIPKSNILGYVTKVERNGRIVWLGSRIEKIFIAFTSRKKLLRLTLNLAFRFIDPV